MFNFDLKALQEALAKQQGNGMGLPPMGGGPLGGAMAQQQPQIPVPEPDIFPAQQQPRPEGGIRQFDEPAQVAVERPYTPPPNNQSQFSSPTKDTPNLNPAAPTPRATVPDRAPSPVNEPPAPSNYETRLTELMDRGMTREEAEANQRYAIQQMKDLNGDGIVTDDEWGSKYTSAANPDVDNRYKNTGQGMGSVYISSEKDENGIAGGGKFESLQRANDALLPEGESWGFEDGASGQWGTYGGPGFSHSQDKINEINLNRTGYGTHGLAGGDMNLGIIYKDAKWEQADVVKGAKLGEIVETPMGRYMIVNGMDGQLALKGLEGAKHGGGNYFFRTVDKGYHMGIDPTTGDVWFQQAPDVVELAKKVEAAGGDFRTAMTSGLYSGDLGVWDDQRRENFLKYGSGPAGGGSGGSPAGGGSSSGGAPTWGHIDDFAGGRPDRGPVWGSGLFSNETASMRRALVNNLEKKLLG